MRFETLTEVKRIFETGTIPGFCNRHSFPQKFRNPLTNTELKTGIPVHIIGIAPAPEFVTTTILNGFKKLIESIGPAEISADSTIPVYTPLGELLQSLTTTGQKVQNTTK